MTDYGRSARAAFSRPARLLATMTSGLRFRLSPVWWTVLLGLALAAVWIGICLNPPRVVQAIDFGLTDWIVASAGTPRSSDSVVVVNIDERSIAARGQWPWPRFRVARLLDELGRMEPASIALDVMFAESDQTSLAVVREELAREFGMSLDLPSPPGAVIDNDRFLAESLARTPVVLAYQLWFDRSGGPSTPACPPHPLQIAVRTRPGGRGFDALPEAQSAVCGLAQLNTAAGASGFLNGHTDPDGILRRLPIVAAHGQAIYPSLGLAALMRASGTRVGRLDTTAAWGPSLLVADNAIPLDPGGSVRIRFSATGPTVPEVSAEDVLTGRVDPGRIRGRMVFVGVTAAGLAQVLETPGAGPLSAAAVHAHLAETLVTRQFVRRPRAMTAAEVVAAVALAVLAAVGIARLGAWVSLAGSVGALAGLWLVSTLLVRDQGLLFSPLMPAGVIVIDETALLLATYWVRQRAARRGMSAALVLMRRSERELSSILETIPDVVFRLDAEGRITFISPAVSRYRQRPEDLLGRPVLDLVAPGDRSAATFRINERRTAARATRDLEVRLLLDQPDGEESDGQRYFSVSAEGIYAADQPNASVFLGTQGIARDVHRRRCLEEQLAHSRRMEAMGMLAAGVAHDLNNVLGALVGYPEVLLLDLPADSPLREGLESIRQSGQRAAAIVQDMLMIARRGVRTQDVVNLNETVEAYLASPECQKVRVLHPNVRVSAELSPSVMNVIGSPVHLSKVIMNMVTNSAEAMPAGGTVCLTTQDRYLDQDLGAFERIPEGEYVQLSIADDGIGIANEHLAKIFEPFYTKKKLGRSGSGLGMAVVWSTIKDHGGYIDIESREGEGTRFDLYLPATRREREELGRAVVLQDYLGSERILVVDDVPEQLAIAARMLSKLGYQVATAPGGGQAVTYLQAHRVDLVVLDMVMPAGLDGLDTYRKILEIHPGQRAIIASGFSESERVLAAQALGAGSYVRKPYTLETIGMAVRKELDRR